MAKTNKVLVIGCGMSGITAATTLKSMNFHVEVVDKGRGYGGRMATRRIDDNYFDHGAQFIQPTKTFQSWLETHLPANYLKEWIQVENKKTFISPLGMSSVVKKLSENIHVDLNIKISKIKREKNEWIARDDEDHVYKATQLLITAPLPQALDLLDQNQIPYDKNLKLIQYRPYILLLANATDTSIKDRLKTQSSVFEEVYENKTKGLNCQSPALTIITNEQFSTQYYNESDDVIFEKMRPYLEKDLPKFKMISYQIKKWRYGNPKNFYNTLYYKSKNSGLYLCGDAFGGAHLNGAFRSGLATSYVIKDDLIS